MSRASGKEHHDPVDFANGLSAKMASASRHVCLFLGAGASKACGLPDVSGLQKKILDGVTPQQHEQFSAQLDGRNLEDALSRLRRIAALLRGEEQIDGLTGDDAADLDRDVCRQVVAALDMEAADLKPMFRLAAWAGRARYGLPVEVFTVNYDTLLEASFEELKVPYFDGFVGNLSARFRGDLVESNPREPESWLPPFMVRLWKLHGSVNWAWVDDESSRVVRLGVPVADGDAAAIYPSDAKYDESRRVPFLVLHDHFRQALYEPEAFVLVSGYAFGDQHLNEILFEAAEARPRSEICVFCHGDIPAVLAERATETPNLQVVGAERAILACIDAPWKEPEELPPTDIWNDGRLSLGDFSSLATFLTRSSPPQRVLEARLEKLLAAGEADVDG